MLRQIFAFFFLLSATFISAYPKSNDEYIPQYILDRGQLVTSKSFTTTPVNDTIESEPQMACSGEPSSGIDSQNAIIDERYRWYRLAKATPEYGVLVYIDPSYDTAARNLILEGMHAIETKTCIVFYVYPDPVQIEGFDWVHIRKGAGCTSYIGRIGYRPQELSLGDGCVNVRTIVHELLHAVGLGHEHQRSDRDDYLNIYWQNIQPGLEYAFDKLDPNQFTTHGAPYDIRSIMHYWETAFSSNGQPTLAAKSGETIGVNWEMSQWDIYKVQKMYNC